MNAIIMGCSRTGSILAAKLAEEGHSVTILDMNPNAFRLLPSDFGGTAVVGNGIDEDVLRRAGIEQADAFAAVTQDENQNIMAAQIARHRFDVPRVVCRIHDPSREQIFQSLGLITMNPARTGANLVRDALLYDESEHGSLDIERT
jgi:trk system potassium uptake protein TrkA